LNGPSTLRALAHAPISSALSLTDTARAAEHSHLSVVPHLHPSMPQKRLHAPVQVTFTGAAFFDGYHQKTKQGVKCASQHGRCNSSVSALWELHPIYDVKQPVGP